MVPYDNEAQITVLGGTWNDWSDGRERIGSALLLQQLRQHGWGDQSRLQDAFHGYRHFVIDHMVRVDGTVLDHRSDEEPVRLYNFWFARFLLDSGDLEMAWRIMSRFYELDGQHFLAFELGGVVRDLASQLIAVGQRNKADYFTDQLLQQAERYIAYGTELPPHEVNYEQSMVAPARPAPVRPPAQPGTGPARGAVPTAAVAHRLCRWPARPAAAAHAGVVRTIAFVTVLVVRLREHLQTVMGELHRSATTDTRD